VLKTVGTQDVGGDGRFNMPLNATAILDMTLPDVEQVIADRDAMLYALSLGLSDDPLDLADLAYTYERDLRVLPTMPVIMGHPGKWMADPVFKITRNKIVHGSQQLCNYKPLPVGRPIVGSNQVTSLVDKGEKGALIMMERRLSDKESGDLLATLESTIFCRADGGFGGSSAGGPIFKSAPDRPADVAYEIATGPSAALLYRLNGDRNPLHAEPDFAAKSGFPRPILHGLCTFGLAGVAIGRIFGQDTELRSLEARFVKPVFPGETVRFDFWKQEQNLLFQASVPERSVIVFDGGYAELVEARA
jgi:acyl dehydratase